ncbi:MAG TPA: ATP synthase F0 subunit C [Dissulfurispiraceae bacterium]|nr:ATP synthase F0 subunit C [Dissulfurispiraceae bacterium]
MMRKLISFGLIALLMLVFFAPLALADEAPAAEGSHSGRGIIVVGLGLAIGLAALGTGIGQGIGLQGATEGVARNPGASGKITTTLIIGLAMIESLAIYALVVVLIILFVNPLKI